MQHTGDLGLQAEVRALIEHVFADRPGDWRVSIVALTTAVAESTGPHLAQRVFAIIFAELSTVQAFA
jgi:hypothetical protein